ncbi:MAG: Mut7-C RNAse domain-containing protein [Syntrophobacteria bacterium]
MERFVADRMLGKLAKWLRVLGYDTVYLKRAEEAEIAARIQEGRILLTRDRRAEPWQEQGKVFVIHANAPEDQLREVVERLGLSGVEEEALFSRCLRCNRPLRPVSREEVRDRVPEYIWQTNRAFCRCDACGRIYWPGSHWENMRERVREILARPEQGKDAGPEEQVFTEK